MQKNGPVISWLEAGQAFPPPEHAWPPSSDAPGLLAAGGALDVDSLLRAYANGIFPWFNQGQPILWWSPDPRMVLLPTNFRLHRSLRKTLLKFTQSSHCEIRVDTAFGAVIQACASVSRQGQPGTWIVPDMVQAYTRLHAAGYAHSVETWVDKQLVGGLYCVALGHAVFGESMFAKVTDASKIALAALVALCREQGIEMVDCQQNTKHLASLGAAEISREQFINAVNAARQKSVVGWEFRPLYWTHIFSE